MAVRRPFRFFFHRVEVTGADGQPIGSIQRRWSWLRRIYTVYDAQGQEVATLFGPILRPWTFEVHLPGEQVEVVAAGPLGAEPLLVQVGFTRFALRRTEAARVRLRTVGAAA